MAAETCASNWRIVWVVNDWAAMQRIITILVLVLACACIAVTIGLIVQYLTENGVMDAARLYESPFTNISQQGPEALFLPIRVTEMVLVEIRLRAAA